MSQTVRIGLIGYGEVGKIFSAGLLKQPGVAGVSAWDLKFARTDTAAAERQHAALAGVQAQDSAAALCAASDLVIAAVTASSTLAVAGEAARHLRPGSLYLDLNSASPGTKRQCAQLMPQINALGFASKVASNELGVASATKMCRSVMIKGLEAMVIESFTAARAYGVEDAVVTSLQETFPGIDWEQQAAYFFQRAIEHGRRRSEEVREVAATVREAGLTPWSASGTAERQAWVADLADAGVFGPKGTPGFARSADWRTEADRILAATRDGKA